MSNLLQDLKIIDEKKILGEGTFSQVYKVFSKKDQKTYALKKINLKNLSIQDIKNLKTEISLHQTLKNKNIIKFQKAFQIKNNLYIVLEEAKNGSLYFYINSKTGLSKKIIKKIFHKICKGIKYLHKRQIIHRDIKPENILLDENFNVKICDFGWSCSLKEKNTRDSICGTYEYMSPEVVLEKGYGKSLDIWGLGVLLYEMVYGTPLFVAGCFQEVKEFFLKGEIDFKEVGRNNFVERKREDEFKGNAFNGNFKEDEINKNIFGKDDNFINKDTSCFKDYYNIDFEILDLLKKILEFDEMKRITIEQVLEHNFFSGVEDYEIGEEMKNELVTNYMENCRSGKRNDPDCVEIFKKNNLFENLNFFGDEIHKNIKGYEDYNFDFFNDGLLDKKIIQIEKIVDEEFSEKIEEVKIDLNVNKKIIFDKIIIENKFLDLKNNDTTDEKKNMDNLELHSNFSIEKLNKNLKEKKLEKNLNIKKIYLSKNHIKKLRKRFKDKNFSNKKITYKSILSQKIKKNKKNFEKPNLKEKNIEKEFFSQRKILKSINKSNSRPKSLIIEERNKKKKFNVSFKKKEKTKKVLNRNITEKSFFGKKKKSKNSFEKNTYEKLKNNSFRFINAKFEKKINYPKLNKSEGKFTKKYLKTTILKNKQDFANLNNRVFKYRYENGKLCKIEKNHKNNYSVQKIKPYLPNEKIKDFLNKKKTENVLENKKENFSKKMTENFLKVHKNINKLSNSKSYYQLKVFAKDNFLNNEHYSKSSRFLDFRNIK